MFSLMVSQSDGQSDGQSGCLDEGCGPQKVLHIAPQLFSLAALLLS